MTIATTQPIVVLGKSYNIACPKQEEISLQSAADQLNRQLTDTHHRFNQLNDFQVLLITALNISRELIESKKQQEQQRLFKTDMYRAVNDNPELDPQTD